MLYVQWSGFAFSDTVVVLSRDIDQGPKSTSYLYVSNDYGKSFKNQSQKLLYTTPKSSVKKAALIEKFYNSPVNPKWVSTLSVRITLNTFIKLGFSALWSRDFSSDEKWFRICHSAILIYCSGHKN